MDQTAPPQRLISTMSFRPQRWLQTTTITGTLALGAWAAAQMHRVEKPETVVRAVGVFEWTGDLNKPAASRLIPVTVFINGELQDGAIFQPRPIPFALTPGNAYELQRAGLPQGLLELSSASKQPDADTGNVDGWWGYGSVEPQAVVKASRLRAARSLSPITTASDDGKPTLGNKAANTSTGDSDKSSGTNSADPDRPTLRRRSTTGANKTPTASSPTTDANATPADDPDRPTLKRHDPATTTSGANASGQPSGADLTPEREIATDALNTDPNRPVLHRGKPTGPGSADPDAHTSDPKALAKLAGLPEDLHQMVAVSDPANRPEHDFARPWSDDAEHKAVLATLEAMARVKLAGYNSTTPPSSSAIRSGRLVGQAANEGTPVGPTGGPRFTPADGSASGNSTAAGTSKTITPTSATPAARRRAATLADAKKKRAVAPPEIALLGEDLRGFTLSYGGSPTFVLTAHTAAPDGSTALSTPSFRYVTVIAQQDTFGKLQPVFSSVTDSAHLDRTPWMRLVGVVDVEASNRASLLFELREGSARQFALYRVLSGRSEPLFTTGTTQ